MIANADLWTGLRQGKKEYRKKIDRERENIVEGRKNIEKKDRERKSFVKGRK